MWYDELAQKREKVPPAVFPELIFTRVSQIPNWLILPCTHGQFEDWTYALIFPLRKGGGGRDQFCGGFLPGYGGRQGRPSPVHIHAQACTATDGPGHVYYAPWRQKSQIYHRLTHGPRGLVP